MPLAPAWRPTLGAVAAPGKTIFRVWAPQAQTADLVLDDASDPVRPLASEPGGYFAAAWADLPPGSRYRFRLDGAAPLPDPASRWQPDGVHGASAVVDPAGFPWTDEAWPGLDPAHLVVYELHVGTFSPEGTFAAAADRLPALASLGVTAVELMPVADFPGTRNWGYDGVALFAPARCYGSPDDLRRLVDRAHALGLAVILDVVYNHLGPDGNYLGAYSRDYFTERHRTPWGAAVNLAGEASPHVRRLLLENACHWVHEYHIDGLRLDATHALFDDGERHFLSELSATLHERSAWVCAEDHRNLANMLRLERDGGWGLDAVWADDLHHQIRVHVAGDRDGYYADFTGSTADLAATLERGWFFTGQHSRHRGGPRGTDPAGLEPHRFVVCLQNHDQVGNRAFGDRLHHTVDLATWRSVSMLLLLAPETPLLFMGQEWAATSPFLYFTDHHAELGRLVTEGRRGEFRHFAAFADVAHATTVPDPQAFETFARSRLPWDEADREPHASVRRLYDALLHLRRRLRPVPSGAVGARALGTSAVGFTRATDERLLVVVVRLSGTGWVECPEDLVDPTRGWNLGLTTEDAAFAPDRAPVHLERAPGGVRLRFSRAGAVTLECRIGQNRGHGRADAGR